MTGCGRGEGGMGSEKLGGGGGGKAKAGEGAGRKCVYVFEGMKGDRKAKSVAVADGSESVRWKLRVL